MAESESPASGGNKRERRFPTGLLILVLLVALGVGAWFLVPAYNRLMHPNPHQESLSQAQRIYNACQAFAAVRGHLPASLEDLVPDFLNDRRALADPSHPEEGDIGYFYFGSGSKGTEPPETVFLASKNNANEQRVVVRFDGIARTQFLPEKWLRRETEPK